MLKNINNVRLSGSASKLLIGCLLMCGVASSWALSALISPYPLKTNIMKPNVSSSNPTSSNKSQLPLPDPSEKALQPLASLPADNLAEGMTYKGLKKVSELSADPCGGLYKLENPKSQNYKNLCTYGPEPVPADKTKIPLRAAASVGNPTGGQAVLGSNTAACYGDGVSGRRVQALYVTTAATDQFNIVKPQIEQWAAYMDTKVAESATRSGGTRHIKWAVDGACVAGVQKVVVNDADMADVGATVDAVAAQGFDRDDRKYVMWTEGNSYCGIGFMHMDDDPNPFTNSNNLYATHSRIDRQCWGFTDSVELHELTHNLGAVQDSAPHATGYGHCTDEGDLMCYVDSSGLPMQTVCTDVNAEELLDCNNDDYFNTNPAAGSYLDTHWNTAKSYFLFTSQVADITAPTTPAGLSSMVVQSGYVSITWNPSTDTSNDIFYRVYRDGVAIADTYDTTSSSGKPYYTDDTVNAQTSYVYTVKAIDAYGNESAASNQLSITTPTGDTTPPTVPTNFRVTSIDDDSYRVEWNPSTDIGGSGLKYYRIHGTFVLPSAAPWFGICCQFVSPNTTYTESVTAIDNAGNESGPATITFTTPPVDVTPPSAPSNLRTVSVAAYPTGSSFAFNPSTDDISGVKYYKVFKNGSLLRSLTAGTTAFTDTSVYAGQTYSYSVTAIDNKWNESAASNTLQLTVPIPPPSSPVFRMANYLTHERLFITDMNEINRIRDRNGWVLEGVAFYIP